MLVVWTSEMAAHRSPRVVPTESQPMGTGELSPAAGSRAAPDCGGTDDFGRARPPIRSRFATFTTVLQLLGSTIKR